MTLERKRETQIIPGYSLTGDLLSFLRCGLQYRYHSGSSLPPSRPVQLWFGEFIHGVLESAYRMWKSSPTPPDWPWPCNPTPFRQPPDPNRLSHDLGVIGDVVEGTLRARGKSPRNGEVRDSAYLRARCAVNELGPDLFPLIASAEEKVIGTRVIPGGDGFRARMYELHGVIDVVTDVELNGTNDTNVIREAIRTACPSLDGRFEVIVDYKGSRRPATTDQYWDQGDWQVQTYAWLRTRQPDSLPVAAGVLIYINELAPGDRELTEMKQDIAAGRTDVTPARGSRDYYLLNSWEEGAEPPLFSAEFRYKRAIRVIPITRQSQDRAVDSFDGVVKGIEGCVEAEALAGNIIRHWAATGDEQTCDACDFRHFCPDRFPHDGRHVVAAPAAP